MHQSYKQSLSFAYKTKVPYAAANTITRKLQVQLFVPRAVTRFTTQKTDARQHAGTHILQKLRPQLASCYIFANIINIGTTGVV
ncbi:hypothetical protein SeMB42_g07099 [Synchytrium endobioticum]|uniref:Uncharacterized protein n=1 Tax=Synchytrium endobioticum TaxID=286115 RepID=A0A507DDT7_9FUNG|nr:hypothetical protein SeMB42_g07099 [Synchytrium endobioticum]TPX49743.1 hypothetical protein SeLEV6574_g01302 [Synchytrium endobioticum]